MSDIPKQRHDVRGDRGKNKGQFTTRKRKQWIANFVAEKKARYSEKPTIVNLNQAMKIRIVDLNKLAERLWCQ